VAILGRIFLVLIIGTFPIGIYLFTKSSKNNEKVKTAEVIQVKPKLDPTVNLELLNQGIDAKAREIKEINVQILETRGKILQLENEKENRIKVLEDLKVKLSSIIEESEINKISTRQ
jgi:hypothetical protein